MMTFRSPLTLLTLALTLTSAAQAQTTITNTAAASVRAGNTNVDENAAGYVRIAYEEPVGSSAAKGYFEFNLTGLTPNTNANATFTFDRFYNSGTTRTRMWVLNQAYPGMGSNIDWTNAMANNLANNDLLTAGPVTGTLLQELKVGGSGGGTPPFSFTLPAPWGNYVFNDKIVLVLTAVDDPANASARLRVSVASTNTAATNPPPTLTFTNLANGNPPTISSINNITNALGTQHNSVTNSFTVGDVEDGPISLTPTATSSDESVVASSNIHFEGSGANRKVYVLAGLNSGTATVTVTVYDSHNNPAQRSFIVAVPPPPQSSVTNTVNASIRANQPNPAVDVDEDSVGYVRVAYQNPVGTAAAKGYFEFDVTGKVPNTNANATITFRRASNSGALRTRFWVLNQAYPTLNQNITWDNAEANDTAGNDMLTNGTPSATFVEEQMVDGGSSGQFAFTLPAPWKKYLFGNKIVVVLSGASDPLNDSARLRARTNSTALTFTDVISGNPPSISAINNLTNVLGTATPLPGFTVGDTEDGPNALVVKAVSSDESVIPSTNVLLSGVGAARSGSITASNLGVAVITLSIQDSVGNLAQRTFNVTVVPPNYPPFFGGIINTNTLNTTAVTVPFTVQDAETVASSLTVTSGIPSYSAHLLAGSSPGGSGTSRTATVTPLSTADGVGIVALGVSDPNGNIAITNFAVMTVPSDGSLLFSDHFDYPNDPDATTGTLGTGSANYWTRRGGGNVDLSTTDGMAYIISMSAGRYDIAPLYGSPHPVGGGPLYIGCKVRWLVPVTTTNAHILHLWDASGSYNFARVYVATNGWGELPDAPPGQFRIAIANGAATEDSRIFATNILTGSSLITTNVTYRLVVRWNNLADAVEDAQLWLNPSSESDPYTIARDFYGPGVPVSHVGLRSDNAMGTFLLDDLKVGKTFASVLPSTTPPTAPVITKITVSAPDQVQIDFTGAATDSANDFGLFRATSVDSTYEPVNYNVVITRLGAGQFRAVRTFPLADDAYYRVARITL